MSAVRRSTNPMPRRAIVTFASRKYRHSQKRFLNQARNIRAFDDYFIWSETDLADTFREEFAGLLSEEVRGFGYWVWKPQVILQAFEHLDWGDLLLYLDSGSHIVESGEERLRDYFSICSSHPSGVLAFQMSLVEHDWTKSDLFEFFGVKKSREITETGQIQAGAIFFRKTPSSVEMVNEWLAVFRSNESLVNDHPSESRNATTFREHRHDQSVFSVLGKIRGIASLSAAEQFPEPPLTWDDLGRYPIHHRRDKQKNIGLKRALRNLRKRGMPLEVFAVRAKARIVRLCQGGR